jgi:PAS domain S-box-containing protein
MRNLQSNLLNKYAKAIVETVREPFLVLSADLRVLMANSAYYMTFDVLPEDTENYYFYELGSGQWNIPQLRTLLEDILPRSASFHDFAISGEFDRIGRNTFLINARQLHQEGTSLEMILIAMENVTERKRAENELNVSEIRYRRLFETAQDGILLLEAQTGQIVDINPFLLELLGYAYQEVVGRKLWEIGPFKDVTTSQHAFRELQTKKYIRYEDLPLETKDGSCIYVEFVSNVYTVNGEEIIQCNIRNITDRKQAEDALQKLHVELEKRVVERTAELARANEALQRETVERMHAEKKQITLVLEERTRIAGAIHDTLAQGFAGIVIQLEAAEDALAEEPQAALAHMLQARQLARESLVEARRSMMALRSQALEGRNLVTALALFVHQLSHDSMTHIKFTHCGTMPMIHNEMEDDLLRLAQEALTNALKHARARHIDITLTFSVRQVELCVRDDGRGFDLAQQSFLRGFGIRIMKERVANMDGQLNIASQPGQGTRVVVRVPLPADNLFEGAPHE